MSFDLQDFVNSTALSMIGDLIKFVVAYGISRLIYEGIFKHLRYGRWMLSVKRDGEELTHRRLTKERAETITNNPDDLSIYVKGVVSFYADLNMDICSTQAAEKGLLVIDRKARRIVVNLDHNPGPLTDSDGNPLKAPRRARR